MYKDAKSVSKTPVTIKNYTSQPDFKRKIVSNNPNPKKSSMKRL